MLGLAVALTAIVVDVGTVGRVSLFFDLCFVCLCLGLALAVRPTDVFTLLGFSRPGAIADPDDGVIQAVVSGLSRHSAALVIGYVLCLACLAIRQRVARR